MRILFIGNKNLQNEAIAEIINSEADYEMHHMLPVEVDKQAFESNSHLYKIALADLASFSNSPDASITLIKNNNLSDNIIAIHNYKERKFIQPIIDAGADYYFSIDSGAETLIEKLHEIANS